MYTAPQNTQSYERGVPRVRPLESTTTNDLGQFRVFGLLPGTYLIRAGDISSPRQTDEVVLPRYYPGVEVERFNDAAPVVVKDAEETRLNPWVVPSADPRKLRVHLVDPAGIPISQSIDIPVRGRDWDGGYALETDDLSFPAGKCLASVRHGDVDLLRSPLQAGSQNIDIAIGLRNESAAVRGVVRKATGEPAAGTLVALLPDDRLRSADYFSLTTDQDGRFEFRCAAPGAFHLFAWPRLPGYAYRNAGFMQPYEDRGVGITLEAGKDLTLPVPLIDEP